MTIRDLQLKAYGEELAFEKALQETGKKRISTFWSDLTTAEVIGGKKGVRETFSNVMRNWIGNREYIAEFVLILNWKISHHYDSDRDMAKLYDELWQTADRKVMDYYNKKKDKADLYWILDYLD